MVQSKGLKYLRICEPPCLNLRTITQRLQSRFEVHMGKVVRGMTASPRRAGLKRVTRPQKMQIIEVIEIEWLFLSFGERRAALCTTAPVRNLFGRHYSIKRYVVETGGNKWLFFVIGRRLSVLCRLCTTASSPLGASLRKSIVTPTSTPY